MIKAIKRKFVGLISFLSLAFMMQAQYTVAGGQGAPLLAYYNEPNRLEVYLVYGAAQVDLSFTSSSPSADNHNWYRYTHKAIDAVPVVSEQQGNTSFVRNAETGCGYFVEEPGSMMRYIWIINYQQYAFNVQQLHVKGNCSGFWLEGEPELGRILYSLPANGQSVELKRQFEVSFQTLLWSDSEQGFSPLIVNRVIEGNPYSEMINAKDTLPLCDTEVTLKGDFFARHFGIEKSITSPVYQATIVELHTDTMFMSDNAPNNTSGESVISAPAEITFEAYANDPVAALYRWKIYRSDTPYGSDSPLINFMGHTVDYTFRESGDYVAEIEVSDRTGDCNESFSYNIKITESFLDIPNAFSPGTTPGINDEFRVAYKSLVNYKCWIFNRWGNELYHSSNPAQGWDGKKGGKYVAPGVYFYVIEATGSDGIKYNKKGSINILRPKNIDDTIINQ